MYYIISPFDGSRTPKTTPMACQFCRGKRPFFGNCHRRGYPCAYTPIIETTGLIQSHKKLRRSVTI
ncbi:hypothetical protein BYT27DRAFT_7197783 [Phlegmacium glaucopus]|nr:hypothetical protein BYT27DRAFT_7197783 [Phlegmacium glaucopus]